MAKHDTIRLPILNAITYDVIYNLPKDKVNELPINYRRMVLSEIKARNFAEKASWDERMAFFALIGFRFSFTIFPSELYNGVQVHDFIKLYNKGEIQEAKKKQVSLHVYSTTDKQLMHAYNVMGVASNHESVLRALDFNKIGNIIKDWSKKLDSPEQLELLNTVDNSDLLVETITNASIASIATKEMFGIRTIDMQLLLKLYVNRTKFYTKEEMQKLFTGIWQKQKITNAMKFLFNYGFLDEYLYSTVQKFTINGKGIAKVQEFINYVIKANNFS